MILVIGERVYDKNLSNDQVDGWRRIWRQHGWGAALRTPAMTCGSIKKKLDAIIPFKKYMVNLLPPDNKCGTWDVEFARFMAKKFSEYMSIPGGKNVLFTHVLLLGRRVTCAVYEQGIFTNPHKYTKEFVFSEIHQFMGRPIMAIPHPSIQNRSWNPAQITQWMQEFYLPSMANPDLPNLDRTPGSLL